LQRVVVDRRERDRVEAALRVDERGLQTRNVDDREAVARLGVRRPTIELQFVRAEVRVDLFRGVDAREEDPRLVARRVLLRRRHVDTDVRNAEDICTGGDIAADDREAERPHGRDHCDLLRAGREAHNERAGIGSEFDFEVCGGGGGLDRGVAFGLRVARRRDRGSGGVSGWRDRNNAR
jgi:hypothetical protein